MTGVLRGFDQFMNIVLDETVDMGTQDQCGMVVSARNIISGAGRDEEQWAEMQF